MNIKVGSKWVSKKDNDIVVNVVYYDLIELVVDFGFSKGLSVFDKRIFYEYFTPYEETYKWVDLNYIKFENIERDETIVLQNKKHIKDYELLYNYKKYHKQFDDVEFNGKDYPYYIDNDTFIYNDICYQNLSILGCYFSTKEHAETFRDLAKENGCL